MIKARGPIGPDKVDTIFIGLEAANIRKLQQGKPIRFNGDVLGLGGHVHVVVLAGETNAEIVEDLRSIGFFE